MERGQPYSQTHNPSKRISYSRRRIAVVGRNDLNREIFCTLLLCFQTSRPLGAKLFQGFAMSSYCRWCEMQKIRYFHKFSIGEFAERCALFLVSLAQRKRYRSRVESSRTRPDLRPILVDRHLRCSRRWDIYLLHLSLLLYNFLLLRVKFQYSKFFRSVRFWGARICRGKSQCFRQNLRKVPLESVP